MNDYHHQFWRLVFLNDRFMILRTNSKRYLDSKNILHFNKFVGDPYNNPLKMYKKSPLETILKILSI